MGLCFSSTPTDEDEHESNAHFEGGNVILITTKYAWDEKLVEAKTQGRVVIANFSATWCGPCKTIAQYYVELSEKYPSLMFLTIDVDELTEFSTQLEVKATPTFFFYKNGKQIDKLVGANKPELLKKIAAIVDTQVPAANTKQVDKPVGATKPEPQKTITATVDSQVPTATTIVNSQAPTANTKQNDKLVEADKTEPQKTITATVDSQVPTATTIDNSQAPSANTKQNDKLVGDDKPELQKKMTTIEDPHVATATTAVNSQVPAAHK